MDNINQPFAGNNPNIPEANGGHTYYNPYSGELNEPFSTDIYGNHTTAGGQQRISRGNRYQNPNTTVGNGPLGNPLLPLLLLLSLFLITKAVRRLITSVNNASSKRR